MIKNLRRFLYSWAFCCDRNRQWQTEGGNYFGTGRRQSIFQRRYRSPHHHVTIDLSG